MRKIKKILVIKISRKSSNWN